MRFSTTMTTTTSARRASVKDPEAVFWAECRKRALELNVPAWMIAEQRYNHELLDKRAES